jgi:hypothetical protein
MNWEAIGSIAEAAGVLFVLISVLYLAVQVRQRRHRPGCWQPPHRVCFHHIQAVPWQ